jgi:hypothetical protein
MQRHQPRLGRATLSLDFIQTLVSDLQIVGSEPKFLLRRTNSLKLRQSCAYVRVNLYRRLSSTQLTRITLSTSNISIPLRLI